MRPKRLAESQQLYQELAQRQASLNACMGQIEEVKQWIAQLATMARNAVVASKAKAEAKPVEPVAQDVAAEPARAH